MKKKYFDDSLYYDSNDKFRIDFGLQLKKRFNITLMGKAKQYLGMRIRQGKNYMKINHGNT